jgi:hypothetical protein
LGKTPCHDRLQSSGSARRSRNLTRPKFRRVLNAHLSKAAGGMGITAQKDGRAPPIFSDTNDPTYQAMLRAINKGKAALDARPRMDMPGGKAIPQKRDFGKTFL